MHSFSVVAHYQRPPAEETLLIEHLLMKQNEKISLMQYNTQHEWKDKKMMIVMMKMMMTK